MIREVTAVDGWVLRATVHPAVGARRAVVLLLPAMMVDARSLDRPAGNGLASVLARAGFDVWRADFRGHGRSGPTVNEGGRWTYDDLVGKDLPALVAAARQPGVPLAVLGHSLGGHTACAAVGQGLDVDALVLLGVNIWMPWLESSLRRRVRKAVRMLLLEGVTRTLGRFPSRRVRMGTADESLDYVTEMCSFFWRDQWTASDGTDYFAGLASFARPVLAVAGQADELLGHPRAVAGFTAGFSQADTTFWLARAGALGLEVDPDHMGLGCDPQCRPLWTAVAQWLDRTLP